MKHLRCSRDDGRQKRSSCSIKEILADTTCNVAQRARARSAADEASSAETAVAGEIKLEAPPLVDEPDCEPEPEAEAAVPDLVADPEGEEDALLRVAEAPAADDDELEPVGLAAPKSVP